MNQGEKLTATRKDNVAKVMREDNGEVEYVPVHYPTHWYYRGENFKNLTQYEYYATIEIVQLSSGTTTSTS